MSLVMVLKATCGHVVQAQTCVGKVKGTVTVTQTVLENLNVDLTIVIVPVLKIHFLNMQKLIVASCLMLPRVKT